MQKHTVWQEYIKPILMIVGLSMIAAGGVAAIVYAIVVICIHALRYW